MSISEQVIDDAAIAIIGMACKFPGANGPREFWDNLCHGNETISMLSDDEIDLLGPDAISPSDSDYVGAASILRDIEKFDAGFFNISPQEARVMDPQHRLFLQSAWAALEDAGYNPENTGSTVGVFAGARTSSYLFNLFSNPEARAIGAFEIGLGNDLAFLTSRVSYKLNLTGPSYSVHTACSTSLVAVHLACNSLLVDECQMALAGGVAVNIPHKTGYLYRKGGILSPDGHCRAFDANAGGTVFGSGVGIVVLKRLQDALRDNDHIYAVVKGTATNNDGWLKASFAAPAVQGQRNVVLDALACANVSADTIDFVEAHGTGTSLGDPIEVQALTRAYRTHTKRTAYCAIGSVKTNMGHLDAAAGAAGLIKAVMALEHKKIPPTLHFTEPNPEMVLGETPFYVNTELLDWKETEHPRRAGVSSFGIGGTNAHVILEEAPETTRERSVGRKWHLLTLSTRSATALDQATDNLIDHLREHSELELRDVAYTLQIGRRDFEHRRFTVCGDVAEAIESLEVRPEGKVFTGEQDRQDRPVVFLFPGQGSQYPGMGRELYAAEHVYQRQFSRCAEILKRELNVDLREILCGETPLEELQETWLVQPALFAVEYAMAQTWMEWGVEPEAMIGHSLGEYVAACLAGVFTLEDALRLVVYRGRMMQAMKPGAMVAIGVDEETATSLAGTELSVAAVNGPQQCVLSGSEEDVAKLERLLNRDGIFYRKLKTSHAFHSNMMEPMLEGFRQEVQRIRLNAPNRQYLSNVTGTWITKELATDPEYWVRQIRYTVRFSQGIQELLLDPRRILLEVGPGQTLAGLSKANFVGGNAVATISSLPASRKAGDESLHLIRAVGHLWLKGGPINWQAFHHGEQASRTPLPTYPFQGERYWIAPLQRGEEITARSGKQRNIEDWFHLPSWQKTVLLEQEEDDNLQQCIIFADRSGFSTSLLKIIEANNWSARIVYPGTEFSRESEREFVIDPREEEHYHTVLQGFTQSGAPKVLHLWSLAPQPVEAPNDASFEGSQTLGFYSLLALSKALQRLQSPAEILVVSDHLHSIESCDVPLPEKQTILAVCLVIPQEAPDLRIRCLELAPSWRANDQEVVANAIFEEQRSANTDSIVAYRGLQRLSRTFTPVALGAHCKTFRTFKKNGAYLITGGLGEIGISLAEHLIRSYSARIVLTTRTALPSRDLWNSYLTEHPEDEISSRIQKVVHLESLGGAVLVLAVDITDASSVGAAFEAAEGSFGHIDGVFHTAGVTTGESLFKPFIEMGKAEAETQFGPKVHGVYALGRALEHRTPDFCLLFSSNATILGGLGYLTYVAANLFMDSFSQASSTSNTAWISANWDPWPNETRRSHNIRTSVDQYAMTADESLMALTKIIEHIPSGQIIVATGDLEKRLKIWSHQAPDGHGDKPTYPRPDLDTVYAPPIDDIERTLARTWEELLGVQQIGRDDDFFDLGGHSLLATRLIAQMRDEFGFDVPINQFFERPTIGAVAELIRTSEPRGDEQDREAILAILADLSDEEVELEIKRREAL